MRETIGGYHIMHKSVRGENVPDVIGSGAFGTVYRAYDQSSGRAVALKTLTSNDSETVARFRREAELLSEISHSRVVRLHDVGEDSGVRYIIMELMTHSLQDALKSVGRLSLSRAADICRQAALGLKAIHDRDVVHRDVKPANILFDLNGDVKVSDLGIARANDLQTLTVANFQPGTIAYRSPEQKRGERVDARSDIYSLGLVLHEMLSGETPKNGKPVGRLPSSAPSALNRVVEKCLEQDKERRYRTMGELFEELDRWELVTRCALIDFYEATDGPNWKCNDNWLTEKPLDDWYGIVGPSPLWLELPDNGLVGEIPAEIVFLRGLSQLDLADNRLEGRIPVGMAFLTDLEDINLSNNRLEGKIPAEMSLRLPGYIEIRDVLAGGRIPAEVPHSFIDEMATEEFFYDNNRAGLTYLKLKGNNWTGCIPRALLNVRYHDLDEIDIPVCDD